MAVGMQLQGHALVVWALAALFLAGNLFFVHRSFYGMRIVAKKKKKQLL
jgi:branched-subunit amino acid ABC-type transport system permease component